MPKLYLVKRIRIHQQCSQLFSDFNHMTSQLGEIEGHVITSINHKWFTCLITLCNEVHSKVAYIMTKSEHFHSENVI